MESEPWLEGKRPCVGATRPSTPTPRLINHKNLLESLLLLCLSAAPPDGLNDMLLGKSHTAIDFFFFILVEYKKKKKTQLRNGKYFSFVLFSC